MSFLKQFNLSRTSLLTFIRELDEDLVDRKSKYFENTIRWYIGNTLLMNEKLLFVKKSSQKLPSHYNELFSSDIAVADWSVEVPTLEELIGQLEEQQIRINNFDDLFWKSNVKFKVPYGHVETHGDLLIMLAHRESEILGKIKLINQVINAE
ncbi:DinB family protein [Ornithinibacillus sp. BX22]|uniref:DinB family protein n=2 Tax=Ornithinibacillus TaxID=484508 RepID=A0A923L6M7_9BACI|nr:MULTISPECIES: DinB family protein [Ornithinibacillus]MBC5637376.1 DinB family protein [Ornithinibacillus hominis]MBS3680316.1 DinB family protein [Ornithinibacillus massiliensis]